MTDPILGGCEEIVTAISAGADLRMFVLARCVQIARKDDTSSGIKALELIARLALGDGARPLQDDGAKALRNLSDAELQSVADSARRIIEWGIDGATSASD